MLGLLLQAGGELLDAASHGFDVFLVGRFVTAAGVALYFTPSMIILGSLYSESRRGLVVGVFWSVFSLGSAFTLIISAFLAENYGWQATFLVVGAVSLVAAVQNYVIPKGVSAKREIPTQLRKGFLNRRVWFWTIALIGAAGAFNSTAQFLLSYLGIQFSYSIQFASYSAIIFPISSAFGAPFGGYLLDRLHSPKTLLSLAVALDALTYLFYVGRNVELILVAAFLSGFLFSIALSVLFASVTKFPEIGVEHAPSAVAVANSVLNLVGSAVPLVFSYLILTENFSIAWTSLTLVSLLTMISLYFTK